MPGHPRPPLLSGMFPFRRLAVWQKAHELTLRVYQVTDGAAQHRFPALSSQLRRSIASIPANIAEGAGHASQAQFNRFLEIALASAREADYHLLLARDLGLLTPKVYAGLEARVSEVQQMLSGLRRRVLEQATRARAPRSSRAAK